jgi:membrane associated rhomboid family serine protease
MGRRAQESRFNCVCGQLIQRRDKTCFACNRRQFEPHIFRVIERLIKSSIPGGRPATVVIMFTLIVGYLCQMRFDAGGSAHSMGGFPWSLYALGAAFSDLTMGGQLWRSVAYSWLHGGAWHIIMNTIVLIQIAPLAENVYGGARLFLAWWLSAIAGAILPILFLGMNAPVIGASGANFGIMGMAMVFGHRVGTAEGKGLRDTMILWAVLSTVFGFQAGNVAHGAHFSGLLMGIVLSIALPPPQTPTQKRLTTPIAIIAVVIFLWGVGSTGTWLSSEMRPPSSLSVTAQARYLYGIGQVKGDADVLGEDVALFLDEVRRFSKRPTPQEEHALVIKKKALAQSLAQPEQLVFDQRLAEILEAAP